MYAAVSGCNKNMTKRTTFNTLFSVGVCKRYMKTNQVFTAAGSWVSAWRPADQRRLSNRHRLRVKWRKRYTERSPEMQRGRDSQWGPPPTGSTQPQLSADRLTATGGSGAAPYKALLCRQDSPTWQAKSNTAKEAACQIFGKKKIFKPSYDLQSVQYLVIQSHLCDISLVPFCVIS